MKLQVFKNRKQKMTFLNDSLIEVHFSFAAEGSLAPQYRIPINKENNRTTITILFPQ
jgi:hypothetical protein